MRTGVSLSDRGCAKLRMLRRRAGLAGKDAAEKIGVATDRLYKWEQGGNKISSVCLDRVAEFYRVPPEYFFDDGAATPEAYMTNMLNRIRNLPEDGNLRVRMILGGRIGALLCATPLHYDRNFKEITYLVDGAICTGGTPHAIQDATLVRDCVQISEFGVPSYGMIFGHDPWYRRNAAEDLDCKITAEPIRFRDTAIWLSNDAQKSDCGIVINETGRPAVQEHGTRAGIRPYFTVRISDLLD